MSNLRIVSRQRSVKSDQFSVAVVSVFKNELRFLKDFLRHYRQMGVQEFYFIDNGSKDGGDDYIAGQPDCCLYSTYDDFRLSNFGSVWQTEVVRANCQGRWVLQADVDEHLVYPGMENLSISDFCWRLSEEGANTVYALMIDMYSSRENSEAYKIEHEPLFFDRDYLIREWPKRFWDLPRPVFFLQVLGGPRVRLVSSLDREARRGAFFYTMANQVDRFIDLVPDSFLPVLARIWPSEMPALQKRPLNFVGNDFSFFNPHGNSNSRLSDLVVAFKHLKFIGENFERYRDLTLLNSHYRRGMSYIQVSQGLLGSSNRLMYTGSTQFKSSNSFLDLGLIGKEVSKLWKGNLRQLRT